MEDQLCLFSMEDPSVKWYAFKGGTYFNLQSREPLGYTIYCCHLDGSFANPSPQNFHGQPCEVGEFYKATCYNVQPAVHSPLYPSISEAKAACNHFKTHGAFPRPHDDETPAST